MRDLLATMDTQQRTPRELARLAAWAAYFGDASLGFEAISEAARLQNNYIWFAWLPAFETVRREPGFEALIDELGLPAYWEEFGYPDNCEWLAGTRYPCS
jgi:hypothetical protein